MPSGRRVVQGNHIMLARPHVRGPAASVGCSCGPDIILNVQFSGNNRAAGAGEDVGGVIV